MTISFQKQAEINCIFVTDLEKLAGVGDDTKPMHLVDLALLIYYIYYVYSLPVKPDPIKHASMKLQGCVATNHPYLL
jgi:hypothetical protein